LVTSSAPHSDLAPGGKLRVGINFGNALLATRDAGGIPHGIAFDLAQEIARRTGLSLEVVSYTTAGKMADGAKSGAWDLAFLAADPDRAAEIIFTPPYLEIDTTYLVPAGSPIRTLADVDREGIRVAVSEKSAYDLFLSRHLKHAELVRVAGVDASVDRFFSEKLDALSGLKPLLIDVAEKHPGTRVLEGRFTAVQQAVGVPKGRDAAAGYLANFVKDIKTSGFLGNVIKMNGIRGVTVAP
jgi:polar amino acid transport system substrate-binding protein